MGEANRKKQLFAEQYDKMLNRSCGECTLCCKLMVVEELPRPPATYCQHCAVNQGCTIYATRPESCRQWQCIWLYPATRHLLPHEDLRPDRCGFVVSVDLPIGITNADEVVAHVAATGTIQMSIILDDSRVAQIGSEQKVTAVRNILLQDDRVSGVALRIGSSSAKGILFSKTPPLT